MPSITIPVSPSIQNPVSMSEELSVTKAPFVTYHLGRCGIVGKKIKDWLADEKNIPIHPSETPSTTSPSSRNSEEFEGDRVRVIAAVLCEQSPLADAQASEAQKSRPASMDKPAGKEFSYSTSSTLSNKALVASIRTALRCRATPDEPGLSYQFEAAPADEAPSSRKDVHATALQSEESLDPDHLKYVLFNLMSPSVESEADEYSQSFSEVKEHDVEAVLSNIHSAKIASRDAEWSLSRSDQYDCDVTAVPLSVKQGALATIFDVDMGTSEPSENYMASSEFRSNEVSVMQVNRHRYNQNSNNNVFNNNNNRNAKPWNANPQYPTSHVSMPGVTTPGHDDLKTARETARPSVLPAKKLRHPRTAPASSASHASDAPAPNANAHAPAVRKHCGQVLVRTEQELKLAKSMIKIGIRLLEKSEKHFYLGSSTFGKQLEVSDSNVQKHLKIAQEDGPANSLHLQFKCFAEQFGAINFHEADWTNDKVDTKLKAHAMKRCVLRIKQDLKSALKKGDFQLESAADGEVIAITLRVSKKGYAHPLSYRIPISLKGPKSFGFEMKDTKDLNGEPIRAKVVNIKPSPLSGDQNIPVNVNRLDKLALEHATKWEGEILRFLDKLLDRRPFLLIRADTKEGRIELKNLYDEFYKLMTEYGFLVNKEFDYSTPKTWRERIKHSGSTWVKFVDDNIRLIDAPSSRAQKKLDAMSEALKAVREPLLKTLKFQKELAEVLNDERRSKEERELAARELPRPYRAVWVKAQRPRPTRGIIRNVENGKWIYRVRNFAPKADHLSVSIGYPPNLPRKFNLTKPSDRVLT
jgi:hypothetical protein